MSTFIPSDNNLADDRTLLLTNIPHISVILLMRDGKDFTQRDLRLQTIIELHKCLVVALIKVSSLRWTVAGHSKAPALALVTQYRS